MSAPLGESCLSETYTDVVSYRSAINAIYGDLMAEESRLNAKETGLLEFLACYASGHVYRMTGLLK